jgi:hypothetical protein
MLLADVPTVEMLEVQLVNAFEARWLSCLVGICDTASGCRVREEVTILRGP